MKGFFLLCFNSTAVLLSLLLIRFFKKSTHLKITGILLDWSISAKFVQVAAVLGLPEYLKFFFFLNEDAFLYCPNSGNNLAEYMYGCTQFKINDDAVFVPCESTGTNWKQRFIASVMPHTFSCPVLDFLVSKEYC